MGTEGRESENNRRHRGRARAAALAVVLVAPLAGLALNASGAGAAAQSRPTKAQIAKTCTRVTDDLANGPDPDVDPVGYALAQIRPLHEVKTTDTALHRDIVNLANAYQSVYKTNDKKGTETVVTKDGKKLDAICPGAF